MRVSHCMCAEVDAYRILIRPRLVEIDTVFFAKRARQIALRMKLLKSHPERFIEVRGAEKQTFSRLCHPCLWASPEIPLGHVRGTRHDRGIATEVPRVDRGARAKSGG